MTPSVGTRWPADVRAHVYSHQPVCIGPVAGMPGMCDRYDELDHVRASGGVGMKSKSIAVNGARMCNLHHDTKTMHGREWRPRLLAVIAALHGSCSACREEQEREYGVPFEHTHVEPVHGCMQCMARVPA